MAFIEFLALVIIGLLVYLIWRLTKKPEPTVEDETFAGKLLLQQLQKIEKTLEEKSKQDSERQEKMQKYVEENIVSFTRTIHGTKRRGKVGEALLKQILAEPIKAGFVATDVHVAGGTVEFAWDLKNGKYLPIDSKMPELEKKYQEFETEEDPEKQIKIKKQMLDIIKKRKTEVKKYLNHRNTIDKAVVAIQDAVFEQFPEVNGDAVKTGVFVAGYTKVFLFTSILADNYLKTMQTGNIGVYKETIHAIKNILGEIEKKSDTINRGVSQIATANTGIKEEVDKSITKIHQTTMLEEASKKKLLE